MSAKSRLNQKLNDLYFDVPSTILNDVKIYINDCYKNELLREDKKKKLEKLYRYVTSEIKDDIDYRFEVAMNESDFDNNFYSKKKV